MGGGFSIKSSQACLFLFCLFQGCAKATVAPGSHFRAPALEQVLWRHGSSLGGDAIAAPLSWVPTIFWTSRFLWAWCSSAFHRRLIFLDREYDGMLETPIECFASQLASVRRSQLRP